MTLLVADTVLIGLALGLRYPVFILVPAILVGGFLIGGTASHRLSEVLIFAVLLQLSYLGGALLRASASGIADQQRDVLPGHNAR
jgi:hypothetical protein